MQVGDFVLADHIDKPAAGSNENDRTSGPVSYVEICFGNTLALANLAGMGKAMNDTNVVRKSRTFWGLLAITIVYFGAYYLLVLETEICVSNTIPTAASSAWLIESWHRFVGFWDSYLSCRQVNELGDALAGAFAPVAFLWLAGAVHIQSQELAEQRRELNETQEVMREQLRVSEAQVIETKASTTLLKLQTEILDSQNKLRLADDEFDKTLFLIKTKFLNPEYVFGFELTELASGRTHSFKLRLPSEPDNASFFALVLDRIDTALASLPNTTMRKVYIYQDHNWDFFHETFSSLVELMDQCSPAYRRLAETYNISEISDSFDMLYSRLLDLKGQIGGTGGAVT